MGRAKALEMLIAALQIDAQEAFGLGLADEVAPDPVAAAAKRIRHLRQPLDPHG
jgi:enoyl-CoA hydratase/carnithine racemase